jgi:hypothetical protein
MDERIHLTGRIKINKKRGWMRFVVAIDDREVPLTYSMAILFARLAIRRLTTDHGWVERSEVNDDPGKARTYMNRLRYNLGSRSLIDSKYFGGYRIRSRDITIHPQFIEILDDLAIARAYAKIGGPDGHKDL